jgi:hypothetical protein
MPVVVFFAWRVEAHRGEFEWVEYPTALGDNLLYTSLGENDFYQPNLRFERESGGLYRRSQEPMTLMDGAMHKVAKEKDGRCFVYLPADSVPNAKSKVRRYFVKSAENSYIEFGERLHWPAYEPTKLESAP